MKLNDLNIDDQFTITGSKTVYCVDNLVEFVDEDNGELIVMCMVHKINNKSPRSQTEYMSFDTVINKHK